MVGQPTTGDSRQHPLTPCRSNIREEELAMRTSGVTRARRLTLSSNVFDCGLAMAAAAAFIAVATFMNPVAAMQTNGYGAETISTRADRVSGGDVLVKI